MRRLSAAVTLLALSGCGAALSFMGKGGDALVSTRVCGVQADGRTHTMHLRIELVPSGALPRGAFIEAEFENPAAGGAPLVGSRVYKGDERTVAILSPALKGVKPRNYQVVVRIFASPDKGKLLGTHTQMCESLVDQRDQRELTQ